MSTISFFDKHDTYWSYQLYEFFKLKDEIMVEFFEGSIIGYKVRLDCHYLNIDAVREKVKEVGYNMTDTHIKFISPTRILSEIKFEKE